jgi:hypothetical protein
VGRPSETLAGAAQGPRAAAAAGSGTGSPVAAAPRRLDARRAGAEVGFLAAVVATAALCLTLAARRAGWPTGQTFGNDVVLVQIYAAHFRHGDFFPVWSSSDAYGMGSPVLLYYQKAFFMVGGVVFLVLGGALKATLLVTLALFMVVGAYGMRVTLRLVTTRPAIVVAGTLAFLVGNEAFNEWLVRGDLAEFSALMVTPWLLRWCLLLVQRRKLSWSLVPVMVVLVDAHNAVALVSMVLLAATGVVFLVTWGLAGLRAVALRLVGAVAATTAVLAPMLVAELEMASAYDPATKVTRFGATLQNGFLDPVWYVYDWGFRWLSRSNRSPVMVQLDVVVTALLVAGLVVVVVRWVRNGRHGVRLSTGSSVVPVDRPTVAVLVAGLLAYLFLQLRVSLPVYDVLAPFKVISFPYRMLAVATPIALVLAGLVADWLVRLWAAHRPERADIAGRVVVVGAVAWLAVTVALSPLTAHEPAPLAGGVFRDVPFLPIEALTPPARSTAATSMEAPLFAEYLPRVANPGGRGELYTDVPLYTALRAHHTQSESLSRVPCSVTQPRPMAFESLHFSLRVVCAGPTLLALPVSTNPFTTVDQVAPGGRARPLAVVRVPTDPRLVVRVPGPGARTLEVHLPTLFGILF